MFPVVEEKFPMQSVLKISCLFDYSCILFSDGGFAVGFCENVKNYNSIRSTLRELYIDGYKTRGDYICDSAGKESSKSVDNRIHRIMDILDDVFSSSFSKDGKISYISIDSRTDITNPLYRTFETRSFDTTGMILYFLTIELLSDGREYLLTDIERILFSENVHNITYWGGQAKDETVPHRDTLRNWLNRFVDCGVLQKHRTGNKDTYSIVSCNVAWSDYCLPVSFFSEVAPLGILGSFLKKDIIGENELPNIIYKHHFIASAIDSEILEVLLKAIREQMTVEIKLYKYADNTKQAISCTPLKIYSSTRTGRQYALVDNIRSKEEQTLQFIRLDKIKTIRSGKTDPHFASRLQKADKITPYLWGTKLLSRFARPYKVSMTISAGSSESYIVERLRREGRGGRVEILDDDRCRYEKEVFHPEEMLPWIRTFYGRILSFDCDSPSMKQQVLDDIREMCGLYCAEVSYDFQ